MRQDRPIPPLLTQCRLTGLYLEHALISGRGEEYHEDSTFPLITQCRIELSDASIRFGRPNTECYRNRFRKTELGVVRPTGIEPVLRVPETLVISFSLRARKKK